MPPPRTELPPRLPVSSAALAVKRLSTMLTGPAFCAARPAPLPPAGAVAVLPDTTTVSSDSGEVARIPPPTLALPPLTVSFLSVTVCPGASTATTVKAPACRSRLTIEAAPAPSMVTGPVIAGSGDASWIVAAGRVMWSAPEAALADPMAARSVPAPVSAVEVTVNSAAPAGAATSTLARSPSQSRNPRITPSSPLSRRLVKRNWG
jgi:hypothetical protein